MKVAAKLKCYIHTASVYQIYKEPIVKVIPFPKNEKNHGHATA